MFIILACAVGLATSAADTDKEKQQKQIRNMAQDTLQRLYKAEPKTEAAVKHAFGYAVFSDLGVKILFGGTGSGKGIAVNNRNKHEIFMKMLATGTPRPLLGTLADVVNLSDRGIQRTSSGDASQIL
jgi:hypothetical protein